MSNSVAGEVQTGKTATASVFRAASIVLVILVVLAVVYTGPEQIPFKDFSTEYVIQLITSAILVALFIERTIEVMLNAWRGRTGGKLQRQLNDIRQTHVAAKLKEAEIEALPDVVQAKEAVDSFRAENGRIALLLGLVLGVIASALGVRLITPLLNPQVTDELARNHQRFLIGFDVVVTGALLGGGASGLHSILDLFLKHVDERRESIRKAANKATPTEATS